MKRLKSTPKPYKLGVALSGGGARGFAHIGAMRALHELGLTPDVIAGVSAGSVVATFYASGLLNDRYSDPLVRMFSGARFSKFAEMHMPRESLFSLNRFKRLIEATLPYRNIEDLPIKTVVCATDLDNGTKEAFTSGPIAERVIASCSIPIVFEPVVINGRRYVDGGVLHNLPSWAIRHMCDTLIGINCSPMYSTQPARNIMEIAQRSYTLMSKHNVIPDLELCDTVINLTETATHRVFSLKDLELIVESGYLTTLRTLR